MPAILAIDQGTTSSRAIVFDEGLRPLASAQQEFRQLYPAPGYVEHDPEDIWASVIATAKAALAQAGLTAGGIAAIGITNQRETTLIWDRATGKPIHNAIVWQDRRTEDVCARLRAAGHESAIAAKTGLVLDPYFSATKIAWLLDHVAGAREAAEAGQLAFGTVDSFLIFRLTGGRVHATDATNAARTLLFDIQNGQWDAELAEMFRVPLALLPDVKDCTAGYGTTSVFGGAVLGGAVGVGRVRTSPGTCSLPSRRLARRDRLSPSPMSTPASAPTPVPSAVRCCVSSIAQPAAANAVIIRIARVLLVIPTPRGGR